MFRFGWFHHKHPVLCILFTWWLSEVSFVILKPNVCYFSSQPLQPLQLQALDFLYPVLNHLLHMKKVRIINKVINIILDLIFIPKKSVCGLVQFLSHVYYLWYCRLRLIFVVELPTPFYLESVQNEVSHVKRLLHVRSHQLQ